MKEKKKNLTSNIDYRCWSSNSPDKKHEWEFHTGAGWSETTGAKPTYLVCKYCNRLITATELVQLEAIKNQTSTTKILIITTIIAFCGLIISLTSLFNK